MKIILQKDRASQKRMGGEFSLRIQEDQRNEQEGIKRRPDLQATPPEKTTEGDTAAFLVILKKDSRDQKSAEDEEEIYAGPPNTTPNGVMREVVSQDEKNRY